MDLNQYLSAKYAREYTNESSNLGYNLNRFPNIMRNFDGIQQGLYIIGAETNVGKTALMTNLFLDVLQSNETVKGIYFSFDDNKDTIINRFLAILTSLDINQVQTPKSLTQTLGNILIDIGYNYLKKLAAEDRLELHDISEIDDFDSIAAVIEHNKHKNLIVCVDGIYNVSTNTPFNSIREDNIARANKLKALADLYKIPLFATVEIRKKDSKQQDLAPTLHDIMETSKFGYNAHVVFMLYPENTRDFKEHQSPCIILSTEKNKLSPFKGTMRLQFFKAKGLMTCEEDHITHILTSLSDTILPKNDIENSYQY